METKGRSSVSILPPGNTCYCAETVIEESSVNWIKKDLSPLPFWEYCKVKEKYVSMKVDLAFLVETFLRSRPLRNLWCE